MKTLPRRERVAGIAEAIKVALIRDGDFYRWMEANAQALARFDQSVEEFMVRRSAELHMHQIAYGGDPFELGSARPLDFGHWSAHKLEALTDHEVHHGEAVAIGIALDARYSALTGLLSEQEAQRIIGLLETLGLPTFHPQLLTPDSDGELAILAGLREFREHLGGELTVTLLSGIGQGIEVHAIDTALMAQAIAWLGEREECHALAQ
ncbi:3-dehydroquinate synthase family protein [Modicisalibacter luteus]